MIEFTRSFPNKGSTRATQGDEQHKGSTRATQGDEQHKGSTRATQGNDHAYIVVVVAWSA
jgi:hypothetical protein